MAASKSVHLFSTDSPLYSVCILRESRGEFYVTGGGGRAKTGVLNALEIRKLLYNGNNYYADLLHRHNLGRDLIMQSTPCPEDPHIIAAGIDDKCALLSLVGSTEESSVPEEEEDASEDNQSDSLRRRKSSDEKDSKAVSSDQSPLLDVSFQVTNLCQVKSDMFPQHPSQNVVRFGCGGGSLLTGGEDGVVRVWKLPGLESLATLSGHKGEITDITTHTSKQMAVSVSRDCTACVWDTMSYKLLKTFKWEPSKNSEKYRFRACRLVSRDQQDFMLSANILLKWSRRSHQGSYIVKWETNKWTPLRTVKISNIMLTAMSVVCSNSGAYVGVGTSSGGVVIYTLDLKLVTKVNSIHSSFVTDVQFIDTSPALAGKNSRAVQNVPVALLSISVDKQCWLTPAKYHGDSTLWFIALAIFIALLAIAVFLHKAS